MIHKASSISWAWLFSSLLTCALGLIRKRSLSPLAHVYTQSQGKKGCGMQKVPALLMGHTSEPQPKSGNKGGH